jgi:hypothetical protein
VRGLLDILVIAFDKEVFKVSFGMSDVVVGALTTAHLLALVAGKHDLFFIVHLAVLLLGFVHVVVVAAFSCLS